MSFLLKFLIGGVALYVALIVALALFQHSLVFPRQIVGPAPALPAQTERLTLTVGDDRLQGVRIPGRDPSRATIMGFPGNAWNAEAMALFLHQIAPAHDVVVYHYRGYATSTGTPSAAALMADALAIHDSLQAPVVAVGFSIGSGVAAHLAGARALERVILATPFDSLTQVAADTLPFLPVRWLFRHEMPAAKDMQGNEAPVSLFIATQDEVIPTARSNALAETLPQAEVTRLQAGHNDIYNHPDFVPALRRALR